MISTGIHKLERSNLKPQRSWAYYVQIDLVVVNMLREKTYNSIVRSCVEYASPPCPTNILKKASIVSKISQSTKITFEKLLG